jgi:hypothetical protein
VAAGCGRRTFVFEARGLDIYVGDVHHQAIFVVQFVEVVVLDLFHLLVFNIHNDTYDPRYDNDDMDGRNVDTLGSTTTTTTLES